MKIWSDGSCDPNPGPGGWGWHRDDSVYDCGGEKHTTNNRMEMTAIQEPHSGMGPEGPRRPIGRTNMTDKFDDGGPAYPTRIENPGPKEILGHSGDVVLPGTVSYYAGMSLHDAFAMAAMQGMLADPDVIPNSSTAKTAYEMADYMIAERNKRRGEG